MVRAAWLWYRELPQGHELEAELHNAMTGILSVSIYPAVNGYIFRMKKG